ncbi:MAG TPA: hypothetical protein VIP70_06450 [Nitrososphaeraceae archaeon]
MSTIISFTSFQITSAQEEINNDDFDYSATTSSNNRTMSTALTSWRSVLVQRFLVKNDVEVHLRKSVVSF